jgi:hypothetical protein
MFTGPMRAARRFPEMRRCVILYYITIHYNTIYYTILYYIILYYTVLCYVISCHIMLCYITLCRSSHLRLEARAPVERGCRREKDRANREKNYDYDAPRLDFVDLSASDRFRRPDRALSPSFASPYLHYPEFVRITSKLAFPALITHFPSLHFPRASGRITRRPHHPAYLSKLPPDTPNSALFPAYQSNIED